jgi:hypothetical protein
LRTTLPVAVTLNRLATDLRVLLRAIGFGIGKGVGHYQATRRMQSVFRRFFCHVGAIQKLKRNPAFAQTTFPWPMSLRASMAML